MKFILNLYLCVAGCPKVLYAISAKEIPSAGIVPGTLVRRHRCYQRTQVGESSVIKMASGKREHFDFRLFDFVASAL